MNNHEMKQAIEKITNITKSIKMETIENFLNTPFDETSAELSKDVKTAAIKYTKFRMDWEFYTTEEKAEQDKYRTSSHNAFIDALTIFLRYCAKNGKTEIQITEYDRKTLGDMACVLSLLIAISNR